MRRLSPGRFMKLYRMWPLLLVLALVAVPMLAACGDGPSSDEVMYIGGIPDQGAATLSRRFGTLADYLGKELDVKVKYEPSVSYAALVTAFQKGDVHLAWFGGLTGVQARLMAPGARAIAQRPRDMDFRSVFIAQSDQEVGGLEELRGLTFTFGSESSTSGHLMPRHFLLQAGVDPEEDFRGRPSFSGSHDKTWKLVESGSFQAGALSEAVWDKAISDGKVDLARVQVFYATPPYYDYNWTVRGDMDEFFGVGFTDKLQATLFAMSIEKPEQREVLELFFAERFIASSNQNYQIIEDVARKLGIIR